MAMFIRVDIDESVQADEALKKQLVEVCPVDIFALEARARSAPSRPTSTSARCAASASTPRATRSP